MDKKAAMQRIIELTYSEDWQMKRNCFRSDEAWKSDVGRQEQQAKTTKNRNLAR